MANLMDFLYSLANGNDAQIIPSIIVILRFRFKGSKFIASLSLILQRKRV